MGQRGVEGRFYVVVTGKLGLRELPFFGGAVRAGAWAWLFRARLGGGEGELLPVNARLSQSLDLEFPLALALDLILFISHASMFFNHEVKVI